MYKNDYLIDMPTPNPSRGFTLIEVVIAISVLAIVMSIAIPSFLSIIQNNYSVSISNDLISSLNYARSEAVKRDANVSICAAADQTLSSCGSSWNIGWLIFVDPPGTGSYNSGSTLLRTELLTGQNANVVTSPSVNFASYNNLGFAGVGTSNLTFTVNGVGCSGDYVRNITISMTGRLAVTSSPCP